MFFKKIPNESPSDEKSARFIKRKISKAGELDLIKKAQRLLDNFSNEDYDMRVCEMSDLIDALHRTALMAQRHKQIILLKKLKFGLRKNK